MKDIMSNFTNRVEEDKNLMTKTTRIEIICKASGQ